MNELPCGVQSVRNLLLLLIVEIHIQRKIINLR